MTLDQRHAIRARHKATNPGPWCLPDTQYIAALEAEVERLREALEQIKCCGNDPAFDVAREALKEGE